MSRNTTQEIDVTMMHTGVSVCAHGDHVAIEVGVYGFAGTDLLTSQYHKITVPGEALPTLIVELAKAQGEMMEQSEAKDTEPVGNA